jgi:proteasome lid subunit RPN8/RPN11
MRPTMGLTLSEQHYSALVAQAEAERPNEACGLLAGIEGRICRVYPVENLHHSPTRYEMAPVQQIAAFLELEAAGWELSGIYHSHPAGPAEPSPTDIAQAFYPESVYVIISPDPDRHGWQVRGFKIEAGQVREVTVEVDSGQQPPGVPGQERVPQGD